MEDNANYAWSNFIKEKSSLKAEMIAFLKNLRATHGISVKTACCDKAKENVAFESLCKQEGMGVKLEYTKPGTPQQNKLY